MKNFAKVKQFRDLSSMARDEDHASAVRAASLIDSIVDRVSSGDDAMAQSLARSFWHSVKVTVMFRGFDETYPEMVYQIVHS